MDLHTFGRFRLKDRSFRTAPGITLPLFDCSSLGRITPVYT